MVVTEIQRGWVTNPRSHSWSAAARDPRLHDAVCTCVILNSASGLDALLVFLQDDSLNLTVALSKAPLISPLCK